MTILPILDIDLVKADYIAVIFVIYRSIFV